MTPLIALPACSAGSADVAAGRAGAFPDLPVLSSMLDDARPLPAAADWQAGVLAALGMPEADARNASLLAARALPTLRQGDGLCLAMPVHAVAGMSRMYLAGAERFMLDAGEREQLRLAFNGEFGSPDVQLHAVGSQWLLQAPFAAAADDGSPESLLGAALAREPATSAAGRLLRRLGAEVEMWLASLPFNAERERRGQSPINSIWFWSGATPAPIPAPACLPGGLFTNFEPDAWLAGLAAHCDLPLQQVRSWDEVRDTPGAVLILQPELPGNTLLRLPAWESQWLEPARRDLAARRLPALRLQVGGSAWQLPARRMTRWFRRKRPWWQRVSG
jgi:hypothetical protein